MDGKASSYGRLSPLSKRRRPWPGGPRPRRRAARLAGREPECHFRGVMPVRPILRYPDPRLRQRAADVTVFDDALKTLVDDMRTTMDDANGAGLAAIQVGIPIRLFII